MLFVFILFHLVTKAEPVKTPEANHHIRPHFSVKPFQESLSLEAALTWLCVRGGSQFHSSQEKPCVQLPAAARRHV